MGNTILVETALGTCGFSWSGDGIKRFSLPQESQKELIHRIGAELAENPPQWAAAVAVRVRQHLEGVLDSFLDVPLDLSEVTDFDAAVYRALREIPAGTTTTYGELAALVGSPGAARAVGRAMATNPIPLIVPCHRVLAAGGQLHGFSAYGGILTKDRLLELEGVRRQRQGELFG